MRNVALLVSFLCHPVLFLLLLPFLVVYRQTDSGMYALKWTIFSSMFVFFGPMVFVIGKWRHIFSDHDFTKRKEREQFYLICAVLTILYLSLAVAFKGILFPLSIIALGLVFSILIFMMVTLFIRASIHMASAMGFVLSIGLLFGQEIAFAAIWIPPLVAWARLILTKHTYLEIITGGILGLVITTLTFLVGRHIITTPV